MISTKKIFFVFFLMFACFALVAARLFYIQVWCESELKMMAEKTVWKNRSELVARGNISDRYGRPLVLSKKAYDLYVDPKILSDLKGFESEIKRLNISFPASKILANRNSRYILVREKLQLDKESESRLRKIYGVGLKARYVRLYPEGHMACHILGFVGDDGKGLEGIEYVANDYLSGIKVSKVICRDGRGGEIPERAVTLDEIKGANIYLTIDKNLQFIAEQELNKACFRTKSKKGVIIIQDSKTSEVLAMACRPNFEPLDFSKYPSAIRNFAVSNNFEPGSTFKALVAAAALEEGLVKRKEMIWCEDGKYKVYDHTIRDHEKQGLISFDEVMEYSSNIGMAKIGQRIGKQKLYEYIRRFGFNSQTGIDLPGEASGLLEHPSRWSGLSAPIISFGQEIGVTAIQLVNSYSALANGGELIEPRIIKRIEDSRGNILSEYEQRTIRKVISREVAGQVKDMLIGVVENGTGKNAKVPGYMIAGKTGTAQKRDPKTKRYSSSAYVASFCGFLPAENPKLTILVLLDEPDGDYWASSIAAPVFREVASRAVSYLRIPPNSETINLAEIK